MVELILGLITMQIVVTSSNLVVPVTQAFKVVFPSKKPTITEVMTSSGSPQRQLVGMQSGIEGAENRLIEVLESLNRGSQKVDVVIAVESYIEYKLNSCGLYQYIIVYFPTKQTKLETFPDGIILPHEYYQAAKQRGFKYCTVEDYIAKGNKPLYLELLNKHQKNLVKALTLLIKKPNL